ncbi:MAG: hypothetical protein IPL51_16965 [Candidatus Competibacteraceae bacterium]|nr:hypothetical protein [Candidatus Competibacteraceae bacterium]
MIGNNNLVEAVRESHLLLALAAAVEVDELPFEALEGLKIILEKVVKTLERTEDYLQKEQRVCELWRDGTEELP